MEMLDCMNDLQQHRKCKRRRSMLYARVPQEKEREEEEEEKQGSRSNREIDLCYHGVVKASGGLAEERRMRGRI